MIIIKTINNFILAIVLFIVGVFVACGTILLINKESNDTERPYDIWLSYSDEQKAENTKRMDISSTDITTVTGQEILPNWVEGIGVMFVRENFVFENKEYISGQWYLAPKTLNDVDVLDSYIDHWEDLFTYNAVFTIETFIIPEEHYFKINSIKWNVYDIVTSDFVNLWSNNPYNDDWSHDIRFDWTEFPPGGTHWNRDSLQSPIDSLGNIAFLSVGEELDVHSLTLDNPLINIVPSNASIDNLNTLDLTLEISVNWDTLELEYNVF